MTISDQITRLNNAKAAIKQSIENKGVEVSASALLDEYPALIDSIEAGGGEGGDSYYEELFNTITNDNTNYGYLFENSNKTSIDVSNLDSSNVKYMNHMFNNCVYLTSIDSLNNLNTNNVTDMRYMFYSCKKLISLDLSNFVTSNVTTMNNMFAGCYDLTSLDLSNFDTGKVTDMSSMFTDCGGLTTLDVSNIDISKATTINSMFNYCSRLTSLDVSHWDVGHITASYCIKSAFTYCKALVDFKAPKNINADMDFSSTTALSHDSLMSIINNLKATTSTKTLTLGSTNLAKLTDDEKAIATGKGWTIK